MPVQPSPTPTYWLAPAKQAASEHYLYEETDDGTTVHRFGFDKTRKLLRYQGKQFYENNMREVIGRPCLKISRDLAENIFGAAGSQCELRRLPLRAA